MSFEKINSWKKNFEIGLATLFLKNAKSDKKSHFWHFCNLCERSELRLHFEWTKVD